MTIYCKREHSEGLWTFVKRFLFGLRVKVYTEKDGLKFQTTVKGVRSLRYLTEKTWISGDPDAWISQTYMQLMGLFSIKGVFRMEDVIGLGFETGDPEASWEAFQS